MIDYKSHTNNERPCENFTEDEENDFFEEILDIEGFVNKLDKLFRRILKLNNMLLLAGIAYIICCIDRYSYTLQQVLAGRYYIILYTAIVLGTLWCGLRLLLMSVGAGFAKRIIYLLSFCSMYLFTILLGNSVLTYISFVKYGGSLYRQGLFIRILLSMLMNKPIGFFTLAVFAAGSFLCFIIATWLSQCEEKRLQRAKHLCWRGSEERFKNDRIT